MFLLIKILQKKTKIKVVILIKFRIIFIYFIIKKRTSVNNQFNKTKSS